MSLTKASPETIYTHYPQSEEIEEFISYPPMSEAASCHQKQIEVQTPDDSLWTAEREAELSEAI